MPRRAGQGRTAYDVTLRDLTDVHTAHTVYPRTASPIGERALLQCENYSELGGG